MTSSIVIQARILSALTSGPQDINGLAHAIGSKPSIVLPYVNRLLDKGLIREMGNAIFSCGHPACIARLSAAFAVGETIPCCGCAVKDKAHDGKYAGLVSRCGQRLPIAYAIAR